MHLGCDLDHLFVEMEECFGEVLSAEEAFPRVDINPELIPEIHLDEEALAKATNEQAGEALK